MQDAAGLREKIRGEMNKVEKEMTALRTKLESQQTLIENQLRSVSAKKIEGDKKSFESHRLLG